ncbi:MAG: hypothetical protein MSIBF_04760 [Candidatus Altiarchaeales archaeon IMC4]|nr:MAG: hypothetical protein MSIBF_04760 [Candidatus Altiarchaeales archaeon IMC4]
MEPEKTKKEKSWVRELIEDAVVLILILAIARVTLGAHTLVPLVAVTSASMEHRLNLVSGGQYMMCGNQYGQLQEADWWAECGRWYSKRGINKTLFDTFSLSGGFNTGDMILVRSPDAKLGDIIIYKRDKGHLGMGDNAPAGAVSHARRASDNSPIIHRVVGVAYIKDWKLESTEGTMDCVTGQEIERHAEHIKNCTHSKCNFEDTPEGGDFRFYVTKGDNNAITDQCGSGGGIAYPVPDSQVVARTWIRLPYVGHLKMILSCILSPVIGTCPYLG